MRSPEVSLLLWAACLGLCGCQATSPGPGQQPRPRPIQPQASPPPAPAASSASIAANADERPRPASRTPFYQLTLLSEASNESSSTGVNLVRLSRGPARAAGEGLALLIIPSGPTGTIHRYALLYPSELEWKLATEWAERLDAPVIDNEIPERPGAPAGQFDYGLGLFYGTSRHHKESRQRHHLAAQAFAAVADSPDAATHLRWAASMLEAGIHAERLFDHNRATAGYARAESLAVPGSYEHMVALYLRSCALFHEGRHREAARHLSRVLSEFSVYRYTEAYERARKLFGDMNQ